MPVSLHIKVDADKYLDFLGRMPRQVEKALDRSIAKISLLVERGSKQATPVDTGRLRASIHTVLSHLSGAVGTNVDYAVYVHEGTRFMSGRPFMEDGVRLAEKEATDIVRKELERELL